MIDKYIVPSTQSVKEVISYMEKNCLKATIVADEDRILKGLFTLGDMRHYFLNGGSLIANITEAMNPSPITFKSIHEAETYNKSLVIYPIIDGEGKVIDVFNLQNVSEVVKGSLNNVPVVIMAGGKGTRLYPYTQILPKALIPIGDKTIVEHIIHAFHEYGCRDFYMILKHKAGMIKSYFGEVEKNYNLHFEEEQEFLGTGGGLSYLKGKIKDTFFLSNCDILIDADLECIYKTHKKEKNKITFVCAMKDIVIPYGIVETDSSGQILSMKEKPEFSFLTNTGLYVLEPEVIENLNPDEFIHLPDIAQRYLDQGENIGVFPISEKSWMDMGQFSEMESMKKQLGV
ncbi:MAG: sugar phosphate nucleotidyltransferase [Lachnospiraceae bacterium]|nr:sugar phosphate nucleotidyltransferase [Lachnospiraceae bacterium]